VIGEATKWLLNLQPQKALPTGQKEVLLRSFHITAKCRYNASIRLRRIGRFTFLTTIVLSLGLILAPLLMLANLKLAYPTGVINCIQVFLAVAVLVYSVVSATAGYETRAHALNDCGDRIKDLSRELRALSSPTQYDLKELSSRYSGITADAEMHTRADYALAMLQASDHYKITGLPRAWKRAVVFVSEFGPYLIPSALLVVGAILILDMIGATEVFTDLVARMVP
jgi:hypothetical protein